MLIRTKTPFNTSRNANYLKKYKEKMEYNEREDENEKKNRLVGLTGFVVQLLCLWHRVGRRVVVC